MRRGYGRADRPVNRGRYDVCGLRLRVAVSPPRISAIASGLIQSQFRCFQNLARGEIGKRLTSAAQSLPAMFQKKRRVGKRAASQNEGGLPALVKEPAVNNQLNNCREYRA
jgi:hypothetical protein